MGSINNIFLFLCHFTKYSIPPLSIISEEVVLFSFFLRVFCLRALGFDDILSSFPFPKRRYFSIFLLFFRGETAQKGEMGTKKKARSAERKRVFFLFFGGKDLSVVLPKRTQT